MTEFRYVWMGPLLFAVGLFAWSGCEGCEETANVQSLPLPFQENFDRPTLGEAWFTERPGRWQIEYDTKTQKGKLCVWQARNMPLFLRKYLPRDVVIEFDAWAHHRDGDVKVELFNDGTFHATGYVLVHGGWSNKWSIIDRLDEHNRNCRYIRNKKRHENNMRINCRRIKRGGPIRNRRYHWKIIRSGDTVFWYINGRLHLKYQDPMPLFGKSHRHFAFGDWVSRVCFDNLRISAYQKPVTQDTPKPRSPASAPLQRTTQIPAAPIPRTIGTSPKPLQPKSPRTPRPMVPKVTRLPLPNTIRLHPRSKRPKLRIYRPHLYDPSRSNKRSTPTLYKRRKFYIEKR